MKTKGSFKKGHKGYKYWLGKHRSQETKDKISKINKKTHNTKEWKEKMLV